MGVSIFLCERRLSGFTFSPLREVRHRAVLFASSRQRAKMKKEENASVFATQRQVQE